jgi:hypothetical protein
MISNCSVLVPSCDSYSDLWTPFFTLFGRFWEDCPFPVYLGNNSLGFHHPGVRVIHSSQGNNWTDRVRDHLRAIDTPYVLLMLEDFFLRRPVPTKRVTDGLRALASLGGHLLRLHARPRPELRVAGAPELGTIRAGAPYRVSTQAAIWRRETILALMRDGESIWQFEIQGTGRSAVFPDGFYSFWESALTYDHHVVERGKWFPRDARYFESLNIGCDLTRRPLMSKSEYFVYAIHGLGSEVLHSIPSIRRSSPLSRLRALKNARELPIK